MTLVRNTIANFNGGVSMQADKLMRENCVKSFVNAQPSLVEGVIRRPPLEHVNKIMSSPENHPYIHTIIKDNEVYFVILDGETVRVFGKDGYEKTVSLYATTTYDYVTTSNPLKNLYCATINDYTFILNKNVTVEMSSIIKSTTYETQALIFVAKGDYDTTYTVTVTDSAGNECQATYESAVSDSTGTCTPVEIAEALATNLTSVLVNSADSWTVMQKGATISIKNASGNSFTLSVEDDNTNDDLFGFYKTTGTYTDLPTTAPNGFIIKIAGDNNDSADDYFVQFETTDGSSFGDGYWRECADPSLTYKINGSTMPHLLIRNADGTFRFTQADWGERLAGDEESAPSPSFIGNTIDEVSTHKGRLVILSNGNFLASDTNDIFSFFRSTVREELDSDPIDITSNVGMSELKHSLPFNGEMLVFSTQSCFSITGGSVFSNSTVGCDLTMEYECSSLCKPVRANKGGYFVFENGQYSRVREIYIDNTYNTNARDITEHVPAYLPKNIYKIIGSVVNNTALFLSTEEPEKIYVYNYYFNSDDSKLQSSWGEWYFEGAKILGGEFNQNILYLFMEYSDGVYLNFMDFTPKLTENSADFLFYLDRKVKYTDLTSTNGETTLTLPYIPDNDLLVLDKDGFTIDFTLSGVTVTLKGEYGTAYVGNLFTTSMELPVLYYRQSTYNSKIIANGLLMLQDIQLAYADTGYFRVVVTPNVTSCYPSTHTFTGSTIGLDTAQLNTNKMASGNFLFPVQFKNEDVSIEVINDSYLPSQFLSLEWIGNFIQRGV